MNISYIITYALIMLCCCISEIIIFGLWYQIHIKSNMSYFHFLKKMLAYYGYALTHLPQLLEGRNTDAPESSSLHWLFALLMPIILPSFMLLSTSWIIRIAIFVLAMYVLFEELFKEGKTEAAVQNDKWIRFLYEAEDHPERYASPKKQDSSETEGNRPLSKEEIRANRIFGFLLAVIGIVLLIVFALGSISNIKNGFRVSSNPFILFSDSTYNTVFLVLLAIAIIFIICFLLWTPQDRAEAKAQATKRLEQEKEKAANYLGLNKGIMIDSHLGEWEKSIIRMCGVLGIQQAAVISEHSCDADMRGRIALTTRSSEGIPTVVLSTREINRQRAKYPPQMIHDMIRFLLGHELTHIRYQDYNTRKLAFKEAGCFIATAIVFFFGIWTSMQLPESMGKLAVAGQVIIAVIAMISVRVFANDRYWRHVSEYRADRISAFISGATDQAITAMLKIYAEEEQVDSRQKKGRESRFHPKLKNRLKELKRKKKWGMSEYFRYAFKLIL